MKTFIISTFGVVACCCMGFAMSAAPADAASCCGQSNRLIKQVGSSAVYYLVDDGRRYVFPNEKVYFTWNSNFDGVAEVSVSEIAEYPIAGNITYKPGSKLVKLQSDSRVYAVANRKLLRWITSEAIARELYGPNWNRMVHDVPDAFFVDYEIGRPILSAFEYNPNWEIYTDQDLRTHILSFFQDEPSLLPDDVLITPLGSVTDVMTNELDGTVGSVMLRVDDPVERVMLWYDEHVGVQGWEPSELSSLEKRISDDGFTRKYVKTVGDTTYQLIVEVTYDGIRVKRQYVRVNLDAIPNIVPVYEDGAMSVAGDLGEGVVGYSLFSEASRDDIYYWFDPKLRAESWDLVQSADAEDRIVRQYKRMVEFEQKNLMLAIVPMPLDPPITYVTVAYGPSTMFDNVTLQEISDMFGQLIEVAKQL